MLTVLLIKVNVPSEPPAYGLRNLCRENAHGTCLPSRQLAGLNFNGKRAGEGIEYARLAVRLSPEHQGMDEVYWYGKPGVGLVPS